LRFKADSIVLSPVTALYGPEDDYRHVMGMGCHATHAARVQSELNDVADNVP
jgi:hypothetical protein